MKLSIDGKYLGASNYIEQFDSKVKSGFDIDIESIFDYMCSIGKWVVCGVYFRRDCEQIDNNIINNSFDELCGLFEDEARILNDKIMFWKKIDSVERDQAEDVLGCVLEIWAAYIGICDYYLKLDFPSKNFDNLQETVAVVAKKLAVAVDSEVLNKWQEQAAEEYLSQNWILNGDLKIIGNNNNLERFIKKARGEFRTINNVKLSAETYLTTVHKDYFEFKNIESEITATVSVEDGLNPDNKVFIFVESENNSKDFSGSSISIECNEICTYKNGSFEIVYSTLINILEKQEVLLTLSNGEKYTLSYSKMN